ncbi:Histidine protein methyltransferase 1, partial [Cryomyces antarcticus]
MARWGRLRTQPNIQILRNLKLKKTRRLLLAPYSRASPVANPNPKMAFSFGFSGDDIDAESSGDVQAGAAAPTAAAAVAQTGVERQQPALMEARALDVDELLSTLPSKISYSSIEIVSPKERRLLIPRRELFDIRMQLMAEDGGGDDADATLAGIDSSDIKTNVYEGGFKSWECSVDLAKLLLDRGPRKDIDDLCRVDHVVELGCGTALPTLTLFQYALREALPIYFTLADYNASVLRLVTLPNLLLTFARVSSRIPNTADPGDLDITPSLLAAFRAALSSAGTTLTLIAGAWSPRFVDLVPVTSGGSSDMGTLLLAAETIYSPAALERFADTL